MVAASRRCLDKKGKENQSRDGSATKVSVACQREVFEKHVKPSLGEKKIAYVWVDALRFEMGLELARLFKEDFKVSLVNGHLPEVRNRVQQARDQGQMTKDQWTNNA